ncbi:hypothetical protein RINGS_70 [Arthrobacter phage Rings]|uniref:Uncharacterized protein n=4 Tax=Amigovirus amigo TaxID=1982100 RepID=A0A0U4JP62_9CAUD|nr:hypothetical protein ANANSI_69 [Arthrobacter phage Anansi]ALY09126.1 hypothetical protein GORGEOUS_69 [Arthrobacter phage Gorgeous]ALY10145.1 hypothetical protein RINGS_70 [Arthrobacter phage Rings]ALY10407.1 hypothetical protein SORJUANA_69 [Arthrobacter phage SorJuana]
MTEFAIERNPEYQGALKALLSAQVSDDPLDDLLTARENLIKLIASAREAYLAQADKWLTRAGASADVEIRELQSETYILTGQEDDDEDEDFDDKAKSKGPVGFQRNAETGDKS